MHDGRDQGPSDGRWRPLAFRVMLALVVVVGLAAFSAVAAADAPTCNGIDDDFDTIDWLTRLDTAFNPFQSG